MKQPRGRYVIVQDDEILYVSETHVAYGRLGYIWSTAAGAKSQAMLDRDTADIEICELVPVEFIPGDKDES